VRYVPLSSQFFLDVPHLTSVQINLRFRSSIRFKKACKFI